MSGAVDAAHLFDFFAHGSFTIAFLFGAVVIALYAGKRLGELISPPEDEEYDFTKMLSLATMVGQDVYRRSYLFYVLLLEFCYVILCAFQPLLRILSDESNKVSFSGASWPLAAALLVVGVLPTTPIVVQIEQYLRRFAHRMAQIPDDFYNRVMALSNEEIEVILAKSSKHRSDMELFQSVRNLLSILDFDEDESVRRARKCAGLRLFGIWTLRGKDLWSQTEYQKYRDVLDLMQPKYDELSAKISELIQRTIASEVVSAIIVAHEINIERKYDVPHGGNLAPMPTAVGADKAAIDEIEKLRLAWEKLTNECAVASKRHIALFSIIARNDRRTLRELSRPMAEPMLARRGVVSRELRFEDGALRHFAGMLRSNSGSVDPWFNSLLTASIIAVVCSVVTISAYRVVTSTGFLTSPLHTNENVFRSALVRSSQDSITMGLAFVLAGAFALVTRSAKLSDEAWLTYYDLKSMPTASYIALAVMSSLAAFPALMLQFIVFYAGQPCRDDTCANIVFETASTNVGVAAAIGIFSVGLCIITDIVRLPHLRDEPKLYVVICGVPIALNAFVLAVSPGYLEQRIYLANQILMFAIFCCVILLLYGRLVSGRADPPEPVYQGRKITRATPTPAE